MSIYYQCDYYDPAVGPRLGRRPQVPDLTHPTAGKRFGYLGRDAGLLVFLCCANHIALSPRVVVREK